MNKAFWKSKTLWLGALVAAAPQLSPLLRLLGHAHAADVVDASVPVLNAAQSGDVFAGIGAAIAAARVITSKPIAWKDAPP
jgi:hypothetical protein